MSGQTERRLEQRALREDWPLPEPVRLMLLQTMVDIVDPNGKLGEGAPRRAKTAAFKAIDQARTHDRAYNVALARLELEARRQALAEARQAAGDEDDEPGTVKVIVEYANKGLPSRAAPGSADDPE